MADLSLNGLKKYGKQLLGVIESAEQINPNDTGFSYDGVTVSMLLGTGDKPCRTRIQILEKWHRMMGDPIISTALRSHVTQALGGHETSGDTIFMEPKSDAKPGDKKIVEEVARVLLPLLNREAHTLAFRAAGFGDAYLRILTDKAQGVVDLYGGDMVMPPLVQAYERGNTTTGFVWSTGEKSPQRLTVKQMARCKMKRMNFIPQLRAQEQAQKIALTQDDPKLWPHMPALVGGSFLDAAEEPFDRLRTSLIGLVSNRILGSIDESMLTLNVEGMTLEQRQKAIRSIGTMLEASKRRTQELVEKGEFSTQRVTHVMPIEKDKAVAQVQQFQGSAATGTISIDDVMLQARLLAGSLGMDLALLGFADQLAGGLGEGGFFRTSVQAAERSDIIRTALTECFHHIVDVHTLTKYGWCFDPGARPYQFNFYGATSALDREQQETRERAANGAAVVVQVLDQLRQMGIPEDVIVEFLVKQLTFDQDYADTLARGVANAKPPADQQGGFGGGFGGGDFDEQDDPEDDPEAALAAEPPVPPAKPRRAKGKTDE